HASNDSTARAASRPLTTAPSIHPAPRDAMSPPANAHRPSGAICAPRSPVSQPGGGANHVPFENGSATQSCPSLVSTSPSGRYTRSASWTAIGSLGSSPPAPANPRTGRPPPISRWATTAWIVAGQPAACHPDGTPRATASTLVDAPGFPSAAILRFSGESGGSNATSGHTLTGSVSTPARPRTSPP